MKHIKVLGSGCASCKKTMQLLQDVAQSKGVDVEIEKIEELKEIVAFGVMSTPAVVIEGKVVHAGSVPSRSQVEAWL
ncbi:MAG: thioredoxin family protein [Zetaproteobacteria bacterium CG12_big_fil_rev_8_21_14_0_65_54_13]|nr:MAG: thioredoxin family protein [Zetaproteobacteria bacterium CG23_combo_of_CG06-09_8_20_14_all_54_7]PIW47958.1 MAG: thioredoxin family protein [Zetaproteobacteria bacterium CG12_big_fil_rev_8_21_14_0_65_54_13]PIX54706.1 MAG: thioredoxin family protein [Zetaproteobacteria bacterium CG_4_10_14_3_um_filter_54_28]PJA30965.1 MAG: thioredoxin family protein [Zetaproteobacteria bacterium CG_4_9_14_3_um_filter_54_145]